MHKQDSLWHKILFIVHHLINPHCDECSEIQRELQICENCEYLKNLIESERRDKNKLLEAIIEANRVEPEAPRATQDIKPIARHVPWHVKQQQLENESRRRASDLAVKHTQEKDSNKSTAQLEQELLTGEEIDEEGINAEITTN